MAQTWQLQVLLDADMYTMSVSVPAKTLRVCITHRYSDIRKLAKPLICSSSYCSNSVEMDYHKNQSTLLDFYIKRLLSLAWMILDQESNFMHNCINFLEAIFYYVHVCAATSQRKVGLKCVGVEGVASCKHKNSTMKKQWIHKCFEVDLKMGKQEWANLVIQLECFFYVTKYSHVQFQHQLCTC